MCVCVCACTCVNVNNIISFIVNRIADLDAVVQRAFDIGIAKVIIHIYSECTYQYVKILSFIYSQLNILYLCR